MMRRARGDNLMPTILQPLTTGQLLDRTFTLYRKHFVLFMTIGCIPHLVLFLMQVGAVALASILGPLAVMLSTFSGIILYVAFLALSQAATTIAVSDVYLDRPVDATSAYKAVAPHTLRYVGIILGVGMAIGFGFLALIIPGVYLAVTYALSITASTLEGTGFSASTQRSKELSKGNRGRIAIIFLLNIILTYAAALALAIPAAMLGEALGRDQMVLRVALNALAGFLAGTLVAPVALIAFTLAYYDVRVRREAFDLHLLMQQNQSAAAAANAIV